MFCSQILGISDSRNFWLGCLFLFRVFLGGVQVASGAESLFLVLLGWGGLSLVPADN